MPRASGLGMKRKMFSPVEKKIFIIRKSTSNHASASKNFRISSENV